MPHLGLSDDEVAAPATLLIHTIADDHYPLSPRVQTLRAILAKLHPEHFREPPPPKVLGRAHDTGGEELEDKSDAVDDP